MKSSLTNVLIISEDLLKVFSKLFLFAILCFKQWSVKENCVEKILHAICRSSHRRWSVRKGVLRNFAKFTGKHLCQSLFFNKVEGLRAATLLKKNFVKFLRTHFYIEHLWWKLLCYWKFSTEVAISEFFEKLCHLMIDHKAKE